MNSPFQNGFSGFRKLTGDQFQIIRDILFDHSGIYFSDAKQYLLESRLNKRLNELKMNTFEDYMSYISQPLKQKKELSFLYNHVTINETYFFRNPHQLKAFADSILPGLIKIRQTDGKKRLKMWSAACSSGEEIYTIAMLLMEHMGPQIRQWDLDIAGTEISQKMLEKSKEAIYGDNSFRSFHTLKGNSSLLGFSLISRVAHRAEDYMGLVRDGKTTPHRSMIDVFLSLIDWVRDLVSELDEGNPQPHSFSQLLSQLDSLPQGDADKPTSRPTSPEKQADEASSTPPSTTPSASPAASNREDNQTNTDLETNSEESPKSGSHAKASTSRKSATVKSSADKTIRVGPELYIIPQVSIAESIKLTEETLDSIQGQHVLRLRDSVIPVIQMKELLGIETKDSAGRNLSMEETNGKSLIEDSFVVIVSNAEKKVGRVVNELVGMEETIVKSLGDSMGKIPFIAGATIRGDGRVVLILDVGDLVENSLQTLGEAA